jgi:hypothetical protein
MKARVASATWPWWDAINQGTATLNQPCTSTTRASYLNDTGAAIDATAADLVLTQPRRRRASPTREP